MKGLAVDRGDDSGPHVQDSHESKLHRQPLVFQVTHKDHGKTQIGPAWVWTLSRPVYGCRCHLQSSAEEFNFNKSNIVEYK